MAKLKLPGIIIVLVCFAFMVSNCSKTKPRDFVQMDTDSAVDARFNFKPGSYWIYVDSISGRTDSFFVRSNAYVEQSETYDVYNYHIVTIAELNLDGSNPADSANWLYNFQGTQVVMDYDYTINPYGWVHQIEYDPLFMYPFLFGDLKAKYDTASIVTVDSFYKVNGLKFYNVAHVYHYSNVDSTTGGPTITKYTDWFYVNDSVGMIRMQLNHPEHNINRVWLLKRYKIVK